LLLSCSQNEKKTDVSLPTQVDTNAVTYETPGEPQNLEVEKNSIDPSAFKRYLGTYYVPSPSGGGTGVCEFELVVEKNGTITGKERCGAHLNDEGRQEFLETKFNTPFVENKTYVINELFKDASSSSFMGDGFRFSNGKLYCLKKSGGVYKNEFCCDDKYSGEACDCIIEKSSY
jgi:hypothetical protein